MSNTVPATMVPPSTPSDDHANGANVPANQTGDVLSDELSSASFIQMEDSSIGHNFKSSRVVFDSAKGAKVWDVEGNEYIDMFASFAVVAQGHCHPRILATITEQSQKLTMSSRAFYNSVLPRFAKKMTETFGYDRVLPMNTGAEAVENALKVARRWAYESPTKKVPLGKAVILSAARNFHGQTLGALSLSTTPPIRNGLEPLLERIGGTYEDRDGIVQMVHFGDIEDLKRALDFFGNNVAAFFVEPIQGAAGIVVPPDGYLRQVRELCTERNVLLICDEIQTGLGRTGKLLCSDHEGVRPDIVLLSKALSGGAIPISAVLGDCAVMDFIDLNSFGSTFGGNPLACAVAMTAVDIILDEHLVERSERLGRIFRERMQKLQARSPLIQEVRGKGLFNAIVIDESASRKGRTADDFCLLLHSRGVLAQSAKFGVIRLTPPLVITEEELELAMQRIESCLDEFDELEELPTLPLGKVEGNKVATTSRCIVM